jgi:2-polyprenyl-6-methoxyphenol hydroxylase-like FAD-dependent oxidoreductase
MKILIIGGGPAGLLFGYLMKRRDASHEIRIVEQNPHGATYGFGVGLADGGMQQLRAADEELHRRLAAQLTFTTRQEFRHGGDSVWFDRLKPSGAIPRVALLDTLTALCADAGIDVQHGSRLESAQRAGEGFDLVVGADGANSVLRSELAAQFGTQVSHLTNRLAWYGTRKVLPHAMLSFKLLNKAQGGGAFIGHFYPYAPDLSTFVVECDERTWRELALEERDADARRALAEAVFAEELDGAPLLDNKSTWRQFPVVTNTHWFTGKHVLLGDALRTVHPSIGSGTRLAFEDALALWKAFGEHGDDVPRALQAFVQTRHPSMVKLTDAARCSYLWYEGVRDKMERMDVVELGYDFLMRTGRITPERLRAEFPQFIARWDARKAHA